MNFIHINKIILVLFCFFIFSSCSTKTIYEKLKVTSYDQPLVENFDKENITLISNNNELNFESNFSLKEIKNQNQYYNNIVIQNNRIYALTNEIKLLEFDIVNGKLISSKQIKLTNVNKEIIISLHYINNSFVASFKSGLIARFNKNGKLIWEFKSNKTLNTPLKFFEEQIISIYVDEIKTISLNTGSQIWFEVYEGLPIYQSKGGQLVNFLNLLFFILPNNKVGAMDFNIGLLHKSSLDDISFISSINNTKDLIHIFDNYLIYLDEGKYLYTLDIFSNKFILNKINIFPASSNIFFNDSLILKNGNFLQAINIVNGQSFWLIQDQDISKKSKIITVRSTNKNIEIYLSNGQVLIINNKKVIQIKNLNIKKIANISFEKQKIIVNTESGKTLIF